MKKYLQQFIFLNIVCLFFSNLHAYVNNRTNSDAIIHWPGNVSTVDIFLNPLNTQGYLPAQIQSQVDNAIAEWNGKSKITLRKNTTAGTHQDGLNEIYFSDNQTDQNIFNGTAVVGVTQVSFKEASGEILEADILINDDFVFSTDVNDVNYLGNVITHEIGHFLGLGHGQVTGSTMIYTLSRGQSKISNDDAAGVYAIYPTGDLNKAALSGRVVGGPREIGIFAAQVQAISLSTGKVAGAAISENDGTFKINGLKKDDQYYLYTAPTIQVALPKRYDSARYDFCNSSKNYRGSFFQACGSSFEGFPQSVKLNSANLNVGNITIRCGLDVPVSYMAVKNITPGTFDLQDNASPDVGNSFVGFFSTAERNNSSVDYFRMNYSNIDWNVFSPTDNFFIELKIINQALNSTFKGSVSIKRNSSVTAVSPKYIREVDGWLDLETIVRIPIDRSNPSDNDFEISVTPDSIELPSFSLPYLKDDYFPASSNFEDSLSFYLVSASLVKSDGLGGYALVSAKNTQLSDNSLCTDAPNTYALTNFTLNGNNAGTSDRKKGGGIGCGSVDFDPKNDKGSGGFFVGLLFSLLLNFLLSRLHGNIKINKVAR